MREQNIKDSGVDLRRNGSIRKAVNYVLHNEKALRQQYRDDYIAVIEDYGVIDYEPTRFELAERVKEKVFTKKFVLISTIEAIVRMAPLKTLEAAA